jgi:hypothetical protein
VSPMGSCARTVMFVEVREPQSSSSLTGVVLGGFTATQLAHVPMLAARVLLSGSHGVLFCHRYEGGRLHCRTQFVDRVVGVVHKGILKKVWRAAAAMRTWRRPICLAASGPSSSTGCGENGFLDLCHCIVPEPI